MVGRMLKMTVWIWGYNSNNIKSVLPQIILGIELEARRRGYNI